MDWLLFLKKENLFGIIISYMPKVFKALSTSIDKNGNYINEVVEKSINDLPKHNTLIKVEYSSLNYKDALSATGVPGITKSYPHTPGIDAAGVIEESSNNSYPKGTKVIITGFDLGMNTAGGFGQYIKVPEDWIVKCPQNLSTKEAMIIGTAGLTAGLSINAITKKKVIKDSDIIISGASGGVGSIAIKILSSLGANVSAISGKKEATQFLKSLGASKIISREDFLNSTRFPLDKALYDSAIDVVGGKILSSILAKVKYGGITAICGNVAGPQFETSVFPFILRNNSLVGIDSAEASIHEKKSFWENLSMQWNIKEFDSFSKTVNLDNIIPEISKILQGKQMGRVLVKLWPQPTYD
tara:strand:+ start:5101 stop:6168 length:1068 start_codon:yes stop_codon:yes gene_type:complete